MAQLIDVPGMGQVEFPDGMTDAQIVAAIKANTSPSRPVPTPNIAAGNPEARIGPFTVGGEAPGGFNPAAALIASGRFFDRLGTGVDQLKNTALGTAATAMGWDKGAQILAGQAAAMNQDQAQKTAAYKDLQAIHPGSTQLGEIAPAAVLPYQALPAVAGLSYGTPTERAIDAGLAFGGNKLAGMLGGFMTKAGQAEALRAAQNAPRDATLAAAIKAGYTTPPATTNPTLTNKLLESAAGKIATQQDVSVGNATVTDALSRMALGVSPDKPLTTATTRAVIKDAVANGYDPIRGAGQLPVSQNFAPALDAIVAKSRNTSQSFPGAATPDIQKLVDSYKPPSGSFDAGHALDAISQLREQAGEAFRKGDYAIAGAKKQIATEIENEIARNLGGNTLKNFQAARQKIAIAHDVQDAIREGGGTTEASVYARKIQNEEPLSGPLAIAGNFANNFPKANQAVRSIGSPGISKLDFALAGLGGAAGAGVGAQYGHPGEAAGLGALVPMLASRATRAALLTRAAQGLLAQPTYAIPGNVSRLITSPAAPWAGGLLGYGAGQ